MTLFYCATGPFSFLPGLQVAGNGGDIGAALQGLASSETVRLLATTMLTAGITSGITTGLENAATTAEQAVGETVGQAASETSTAFITELTDKLQSELIAAGVRTGVDTAINGGDIGENMIANLQGAAVHALGAQMANEIGAASADGDLDYVTHKIAHAALGGAMDAAMGGDGTAGAIGGVVGEITAEAYLANRIKTGLTESDLDKLERVGVDFSKLAAGLVAAGAGADVDTAADAAENAAENNAVETLFDALFVLADTGKIAWGWYTNDDGLLQEGIVDLTADSVALVLPCVPAGSTRVARIFRKAASKADEAVDFGKTTKHATGGNGPERYSRINNRLKESTARGLEGKTVKVDDALDFAENFLGAGYKDMGNGRFISLDGTRQVRMGDADILGHHAGGPHMNLEILEPIPNKPGRMRKKNNIHIYLKD